MTIRNHRLRAITPLLAALALVAALVWPVAAAAAPTAPAAPDRPAAPTQPTDCEGDQSGTIIEGTCEDPGGPGGPGGPGDNDGGDNDGGGGIDAAAVCGDLYPNWDDCVAVVNANGMHPGDICGYVVHPDQSQLNYYHPEAPAGYVLYYNICPREGLYYSEDTQANEGGGPPPPPDPEVVAEGVWVRVQAELPAPALQTWPPQNMSSVLRLPSFVAVTNWPATGVIEDSGCDNGTCVALEATPSLSYDPGDGSDAIACEPGGTTFDRYGAEPEDQAAGEACAHAFTRRTGVRGRPEAWPGVVAITWNAEWWEVLAGGGIGETGDFDPVVLDAPLPRVVTELVSVITGVTPSGGSGER
jgi:hypothetical protein